MARQNDKHKEKETGMKINRVVLLWLLFLPSLFCTAQETENKSGNLLFRQALSADIPFDKALEQWADDIRDRTAAPASLYYNMANALALDGKENEALVLYSRALSLKPGSSDIRQNRNLLLRAKELDEPRWNAFEGILWFPLWLAGYWGVWGILAIAVLAALSYCVITFFGKKIPSIPVTLAFLIFLLYGGAVLGSWEIHISGLGVVRDDETPLYRGDSPLYPSSENLSGGEEVRILEERDGWVLIRSISGKEQGWCEGFSVLRAEDVIASY